MHSINFPAQKRSFSAKTEKWAKQCIDAAEDMAIFNDNGLRQTYKNKLVNYRLASGILDEDDVKRTVDPFDLGGKTFPAKMQNYPIVMPKIDVLIGEERKRRDNFKVFTVNEDAITEKENEMKKQVFEVIGSLLASDMSEEEAKEKLKYLEKFHKYEFQDLRERLANQILSYLYNKNNLKEVFSKAFEDLLIAGEEILCVEVIGGEPTLRRVDPLSLFTVRSGDSPFIEDSDIIVEERYMSPGQIVDRYYDKLSASDIKKIEEYMTEGDLDMKYNYINIDDESPNIIVNGEIDVEDFIFNRGAYMDLYGNIRVVKVVWRSYKKVGKLKRTDEDGIEYYEYVNEFYEKSEGEEIEWFWVTEWWEGIKIGKDIYINIGPRPVQYRDIDNIGRSYSGYFGIVNNVGNMRAISLMDRMKPYQYLYNVFMYRTELAFAKAKGRIGKLNLAKVPDGMEPEEWMYYAEILGWALEDPFKEAKKGAATGKLAGTMNESAPVIDLELGNYIQQHILILNYIEEQLGSISGVTRQRQGQIENRETLGGVERSVVQSSHITEKYYQLHNHVKRKALTALIETARTVWKDGTKKKLQYIADDFTTDILNIEDENFSLASYGVFLQDSSKEYEIINTIKQLAHAGLQNQMIDFEGLLDILSNDSVVDMKNKIKYYQDRFKKEQEEKHKQQMQMLQEQQKAQKELEDLKYQRELELKKIDVDEKQKDRDLELEKLKLENETKLKMKELDYKKEIDKKYVDVNRNGIPDVLELQKVASKERIEMEKIKLKEKEIAERLKSQNKKS
jgi:hypothetical protein